MRLGDAAVSVPNLPDTLADEYTDTVARLLSIGSAPNAVDLTGGTPLHRVAGREHPEAMPVLLAHGTNAQSGITSEN